MRLYGYTCEDCDSYARRTQGHRTAKGELSVKCPDCGHVEKIRKYRDTLGRVIS